MLFLANENFPFESIRKLREGGYDIASIIEDSPGIEDKEILFQARKENRIILTFDKGYGDMIYRLKMPAPKGVVLFRFDPASPDEPYKVLTRILLNRIIQFQGMFTVIDRNKIRQRRL